jgi:hypothetical protein
MRRVLAVLLSLMALLAVAATPALGHEGELEPHRFSFRQNGVSADAFWQTCQEDTPSPGLTTCESVSIFGFDGRMVVREGNEPPQRQGGQACVSLDVIEGEFGPPITSEFGCTEVLTFQAARDLSSATLSATVAVEALVCEEVPEGFFCEPSGDPMRDVAVTAEWTSMGPVTRFRDRSVSRTETDGLVCVFKQSGRGIRTDAVATATVDGTALGESQFAAITKGRFQVLDRCR